MAAKKKSSNRTIDEGSDAGLYRWLSEDKKTIKFGKQARSKAAKYGKPVGNTYVGGRPKQPAAMTTIQSSGGTGKGTTPKLAYAHTEKRERKFLPDSRPKTKVSSTPTGETPKKLNQIKGTKSPKPSFAKNNLQKRKATSKMR